MGRSVRRHIGILIICSILSSCASNKPKILIIGDSISMGYTPFVKKELRKKARVYHNPKNAQHTKVGLKNINKWINKKQWDIVQFNWGLWDMCYRNNNIKPPNNKDAINGHVTVNLDEYASNLDSIIIMIKKQSSAKLIFITTSHVPDNNKGRHSKDVLSYNRVAKNIMEKHGIPVNDIYKQTVIIHNELGKAKNDAHYTKSGYKMISELVTTFLENELKTLPTTK